MEHVQKTSSPMPIGQSHKNRKTNNDKNQFKSTIFIAPVTKLPIMR